MTAMAVHGSMTIEQVHQAVQERQRSLLQQISDRNTEIAEIQAELRELRDELHNCPHAAFLQWARADAEIDYEDEDEEWTV